MIEVDVKTRGWAAALAVVLLLAGVAGPAGAQEDETEEERHRRETLERVERLERELRELKEELRVPPAALDRQEEGEQEADEPVEEMEPEVVPGVDPDLSDPGEWEVGYRGAGGGFYVESPDGDVLLRQLGYVQATAHLFHDDFERADEPGDFDLRRARLDWIVSYRDRYRLFVEIDGGPGSTPGASDFALVVAQLDWGLRGDDVVLSAGKFITPFSTENLLSSRSLDTVERYIALNSMFLLPALDVQFGTMLSGRVADDRLEYFVGAFNGNGRANDNISDDNSAKEVQAKVNWYPRSSPEGRSRFGFGLDTSDEERQSLQLRGLSFTPWVAVPVEGRRWGATADFGWSRGRLHLRGEGLAFEFDDADASLAGGFLQGAWALRGDRVHGEELVLRVETAAVDSDRVDLDGDRIDAVTLGYNLFRLGVIRLQVDLVAEHYNGLSNLPADVSRVEGDGWKPYLLTELQLKF